MAHAWVKIWLDEPGRDPVLLTVSEGVTAGLIKARNYWLSRAAPGAGAIIEGSECRLYDSGGGFKALITADPIPDREHEKGKAK